ncbi:MAG TPA: ATP-dependent DNA helicase [Actinocrinis sp.]|jgi:superfamily I DNA/RNA helicase/RecB family exonuclease|uniref:ATP-dependent helicase n=1 Tax=Actinocrinis sp. TaxID=1920516 RepID=UPI002DDD58EE|nr:ATP-dependent DNA helicase [Actinocrinis sp.]HEV3173505.1 ATP-dependent DNA helicase [Actinocrinis sp.]
MEAEAWPRGRRGTGVRRSPFRLIRPLPPERSGAPTLDPEQRDVVEHRDGPLLVLAGPGTGKTTTLVEAVLARTRGEGALASDEILVLTFSRAAAAELRDRIGARLTSVSPDESVEGDPASAGETCGPGSAHLASQAFDGGVAAASSATGAPTVTTFHSFCYALLGQYEDPELLSDPLRLLSGPEQDVVIRELVRGTVEPGAWGSARGGWPEALRAALGTRGFAEELRAVLSRARDIGLHPEDLAEFAERARRADWRAAARFFAEYLDVADARGVLDYGELVHRAVLLAETDEIKAALRRRYRAVFVDEYQDTDQAQVRLLRALAGDGRDLVVVGDPDQSIYAFRGADVTGILDFPERFPRRNGNLAPIAVLGTSRRAGPVLLRASREVARRMPLARLPADRVRAHRELTSAVDSENSPYGAGSVEVVTFPDEGLQFAAIADLLRRAHLEQGVPWEQMAVLVRIGDQLTGVRRALMSANVPVEVLGHDLPLAREPAVATLLTALRCAAEPGALTAQTARSLLTGPLAGMDGGDLRRLGRALRSEEQAALALRSGTGTRDEDAASAPSAAPDVDEPKALSASSDPAALSAPSDATAPSEPGEPTVSPSPNQLTAPSELGDSGSPDTGELAGPDMSSDLGESSAPAGLAEPDEPSVPLPRPAEHLIREAVADPRVLAAIDPKVAGPALAVARLLDSARRTLAEGGTVEDALWILWHGDAGVRPPVRTGWPERLRRAVERGGAAGRLADRDLDAVIALFALAARAQQRTGHAGVTDFISELQAEAIAADVLAEKAVRGGAVQVLTAHRSKGLQWRVVVVAGVQEGLWPDLRRRGSLLEPDRIGRSGLVDPLSPAALLAEERRLFYVAVTRARERLVVTAVDGEDEDGDSPSRFLRELSVQVRPAVAFRRRPLNLAALLAELRRAATDPAAPPALREAAIGRLAKLASATAPDGGRLVPHADPRRWWGLYDYTDNDTPVADPDAPVALSASAVASLDTCGLRWFLERKASAQEPSSDAQGIGLVFHALAEEVATGRTKADIDVLMDRLDRVWDSLPFDAPWKSEQERRVARRALERFLVWHDGRADGRSVSAAEHDFDSTLTVGGVPVRLRGAIDRIEVDAEGHAYLVDFKTSANPKTRAKAARDPQLGVYQLVVEAGAYEGGDVAQAELVYPRDTSDSPEPTVRVQSALAEDADPQWAANLVAEVARRVLDERFHAYGEADACGMCRLRKACPRQPEGRELPQ